MITVTEIDGPEPAHYFYLLGSDPNYPMCFATRAVLLEALTKKALFIADEKAALVKEVERQIENVRTKEFARQELRDAL